MGMSQETFVSRYSQGWLDLEEMLDRLEKRDVDRPTGNFPRDYQRACRHLAMARSRGYSLGVRVRLERIVERGHAVLYRHRRAPWDQIWEYVAGGFARDVREHWPFLAVASLLFWGSFLGMLGWVLLDPEVATKIAGADQLIMYESMYSETNVLEREAGDDLAMFGFYIFNNVGIALRTFGSGLFFGAGSLFVLVFNGVFFGIVAGHLSNAGYGEQFWPFVIGHGAFELPAIVLSGMVGLKIGAAPLWPGRRRRVEALMEASRESVGIIFGFSVMLLIAAFIEAFWSPRVILGVTNRVVVGAMLWALVCGYFAFAGRGRRGSQ